MIRTYEIDLDDKLVEDSSKIFESLGTDVDSAIKIFLTQAVLRKGFSFEVAVPKNEEEEIKNENQIEENALESISEKAENDKSENKSDEKLKAEETAKTESSENKAENESEPELSQNENLSDENVAKENPSSENLSEIPDSVKIAELKKDLSELSENPAESKNDAESSPSESKQNSNPEDEDETAPENLFEQWKENN